MCLLGPGRRNGGSDTSPQKLSHIKEGSPPASSVSVHASSTAPGAALPSGAGQSRHHKRRDSLDELYWRGSHQQLKQERNKKNKRRRWVRPRPTGRSDLLNKHIKDSSPAGYDGRVCARGSGVQQTQTTAWAVHGTGSWCVNTGARLTGVPACAGDLAEELPVLLRDARRVHSTLVALEERCALLACCECGVLMQLHGCTTEGDDAGLHACRLQRMEVDVWAIREAVQARSATTTWEAYLVGAAAGFSAAAVLGWAASRALWRSV